MSSTHDIQPPDQPLDPHTLRVVLEKLTSKFGDLACAEVVSKLLATANPRARVVVLPEPDEINADGTQAAWKRRGWGGYYVMADSELGQLSQAGHGTPECARARALAILAAAEFAGGAQ